MRDAQLSKANKLKKTNATRYSMIFVSTYVFKYKISRRMQSDILRHHWARSTWSDRSLWWAYSAAGKKNKITWNASKIEKKHQQRSLTKIKEQPYREWSQDCTTAVQCSNGTLSLHQSENSSWNYTKQHSREMLCAKFPLRERKQTW